jgi:hypothetical protein
MGIADQLEQQHAHRHGERKAGQQLCLGVQDDEARQQQLGGGVDQVEHKDEVLCGRQGEQAEGTRQGGEMSLGQ